jgi:DNA-directed RNA polymerase
MTFPYGVSAGKMKKQIAEAYREITRTDLDDSDATYFAKRVREACKKLLPGPTEVMKYIRGLARHRANSGHSLAWITPSRFPVDNAYNKKAEPKRLYCGTREYLVSEGYLPDLDSAPMVSGSAPNLIHSLDAAHLALTVNDAVQRGITDLLTVHDSFLCLAPYAAEFGRVLRVQMALMYKSYDVLRILRDHNTLDATKFPLPKYGKLDPLGVQFAEWPFA